MFVEIAAFRPSLEEAGTAVEMFTSLMNPSVRNWSDSSSTLPTSLK
jgi:hypothetical protein